MIKIDNTQHPIVVAQSVIEEVSEFVEANFSDYKVFFLADENSEEHCLPLFNWSENQTLIEAEVLTVPAGESSKCMSILERLAETLIDLHATKKTLIINLGGGMVSDLGGFLAASYKRGIPFVNVPTTLLAMIDASVGGKTAVNVGDYKNQIGAFYFPEAVFCGLEFLKTLPNKELKSGYAELIKHNLIVEEGKKINLNKVSVNEIPNEELVALSISIKNQIVQSDPEEKGNRKKLNFGHTIGHAIESFSHSKNKALLHGEAVAIGILVESWISNQYGNLTTEEFNEIKKVILKNFELFPIEKSDHLTLLDLMQADKKNENLSINFTLLEGASACTIDHYLSEVEIEKALNWYHSIL